MSMGGNWMSLVRIMTVSALGVAGVLAGPGVARAQRTDPYPHPEVPLSRPPSLRAAAPGIAAAGESSGGLGPLGLPGQPSGLPSTDEPARSAAGPGTGAPKPSGATSRPQGSPEEQVMNRLHLLNQLEISAGRLAQQRARSPEVKDFGARLVREHEAADRRLGKLAREKNITLSSDMRPEPGSDLAAQQQAIERLRGLTGRQLERELMTAMERGHEKAVTMVSDARASTDDPELKTLLGDLLPSLEAHHRMAGDLADSLGAGDRDEPPRRGQPRPSPAPSR